MVFDLNSKSLKSTRYCTLNISVHGLKFARDLILGCVIELHLLDFLIVFFFQHLSNICYFFLLCERWTKCSIEMKEKTRAFQNVMCSRRISNSVVSSRPTICQRGYANLNALVFVWEFISLVSLSVCAHIFDLRILYLSFEYFVLDLFTQCKRWMFIYCVCVLCGAQFCIALYHTIIIMQ